MAILNCKRFEHYCSHQCSRIATKHEQQNIKVNNTHQKTISQKERRRVPMVNFSNDELNQLL